MWGDGFGVEVDAGRKVVDGEVDGFVEAGFADDEEPKAGGAALTNESCLAGEAFVFLV